MVTSAGRQACALAALAVLAAATPARAEPPPQPLSPCPAQGAAVAVIGRTHELYLCRDGAPEARIAVALGRGGMEKRRRGDARTPVGTYAFGEPQPSRRFGTFIPISYPTPAQVAQGYTGGGIGIHGPPRGWRDAVAARALDWTDGCVATGTEDDVERVARFVRQHRPVALIR